MSEEKGSALDRVLSSIKPSEEAELTPEEVRTQDEIDGVPSDVMTVLPGNRVIVLEGQRERTRRDNEVSLDAFSIRDVFISLIGTLPLSTFTHVYSPREKRLREKISSQRDEIERLQRRIDSVMQDRGVYIRAAEWFAHNSPGTPIPDWMPNQFKGIKDV